MVNSDGSLLLKAWSENLKGGYITFVKTAFWYFYKLNFSLLLYYYNLLLCLFYSYTLFLYRWSSLDNSSLSLFKSSIRYSYYFFCVLSCELWSKISAWVVILLLTFLIIFSAYLYLIIILLIYILNLVYI
jgi:hypothetical protein